MKSTGGAEPVTFAALQAVLLGVLKTRINNGHFTERGLARVLGVSQPQLHNVIKGKRRLQTELADRILVKFGMSVPDLVDIVDVERQSAGLLGQNSIFVGAQRPPPTSPDEAGKRGPKSETYRSPADEQVS